MRVHAHVQRSFRLKTESARRIGQLQRAQAYIRQQAIGAIHRNAPPQLSEAGVDERDLRRQFLWNRRQPPPRDSQRLQVFIEANQTTLWAEAPCDCFAVAAQTHRGVDIGPAAPDIQKIGRFF